MQLRQMKIFETVSRHRNITNAAHELGLSQPAVSNQLKLLEEELGQQFCDRSNHGIALTPNGQDFLDSVLGILTRVEELEAKYKKVDTKREKNVFSVGTTNTLSATVVPELLVVFKKRKPGQKLIVETGTSRQIEEMIQSHTLEIGLINMPSHLSGCEYEPYLEHEAVAFVPRNDPRGDTLMSSQ